LRVGLVLAVFSTTLFASITAESAAFFVSVLGVSIFAIAFVKYDFIRRVVYKEKSKRFYLYLPLVFIEVIAILYILSEFDGWMILLGYLVFTLLFNLLYLYNKNYTLERKKLIKYLLILSLISPLVIMMMILFLVPYAQSITTWIEN